MCLSVNDKGGNFMFECFFPDECRNSTYEIDFESLYRQGYRGLIFDIDNTLVPHGAPADERARNLFYLPKSIFPKESPCATCREFEDCRYSKGICWVDVMAAYGEDKWLYPTPDCPYAPVPLNDIKVW